MFQLFEQLHKKGTKHNLELTPEKSFFMLPKVEFLGHEFGYGTTEPIHSKIAAVHDIPSRTGKIALLSSISALIFIPNLLRNFMQISNHFMIFYTTILLGTGPPILNIVINN